MSKRSNEDLAACGPQPIVAIGVDDMDHKVDQLSNMLVKSGQLNDIADKLAKAKSEDADQERISLLMGET